VADPKPNPNPIRWQISSVKLAPNQVQSTPRHTVINWAIFHLGKFMSCSRGVNCGPGRSRIRISCQVRGAIVRLRPFWLPDRPSWPSRHTCGLHGLHCTSALTLRPQFLEQIEILVLVSVFPGKMEVRYGDVTSISRYKSWPTIWAIPVCSCTRCLTCMGNCRQHF